MAIVHIRTTHGAVPLGRRARLAANLAALAYEAEGFTGSKVAPALCWTFFDERPEAAFSTAAGLPSAPLYYIVVTTLTGTLERSAKRQLGAYITPRC